MASAESQQVHHTKSQQGPAQGAGADPRGELESSTTDSLGRGTPNRGAGSEEKACLEPWHDRGDGSMRQGLGWKWDTHRVTTGLSLVTVKRVLLHPHLAAKLTSNYSHGELLFNGIITAITTSCHLPTLQPSCAAEHSSPWLYKHFRNFDTKLPAF